MKIIALLALGALSLGSCASADGGISEKLTEQFDASSSAPIDIAKLGSSTWDKFRVLEPYTTNAAAEQRLGFKWDVERQSSQHRPPASSEQLGVF